MTKINWVLGIDGGGTRCRARLESIDGQLICERETGPANVAQNPEQAYRSVLLACQQVLEQLPQNADTTALGAVIGLAGVNINKYADIARQWQLPLKKTEITTDLDIACAGAHLQQTGALIITGTGSSAYIKTDTVQKTIGGHGFPLGDEASGAWIGWKALQHTLLVFDGLHEQSQLFDAVCSQLAIYSAEDIVAHTLHFRSVDYATLAPLVTGLAAQGEPAGCAIMQTGSDYLTQLFTQIKRCDPGRIAMTGGLSAVWQSWLSPQIQAELSVPLASPVCGAVWLAKNRFPL